MKATAKIISGYGLLIALLAGLAVYQAITIHRMQSIIRDLSENHFQYALACLQALRDRDLVEEYAWKSFALADPDYLNQLHRYQEHFEASLSELKAAATTPEGQAAVKRLRHIWDSYKLDLRLLQKSLPQGQAVLPQSLQEGMEELRSQIYSLYQYGLHTMSEKAENSRQTADSAALLLWCIAGAALGISILVSFLIYRSISKPLAHLTEGTRAIAEGKSFYRLDTSRNDELSQIARDVNRMTLRLNELEQLKKGFVSHMSDELKSDARKRDEKNQSAQQRTAETEGK